MKITGLLLLLAPLLVHGQTMDSIPFGKVKRNAGVYALGHWGIDEITLGSEQAYPFGTEAQEDKNDFAEGVWTLLTGLSTSTLSESAWIFPNSIWLSNKKNSVYVPLIVNGYHEKNRTRVKDEEGNLTLETDEQMVLLLDEGAWGWLIDQGDTLGSFLVSKRQLSDSYSDWQAYIGDVDWLTRKLKKYGTLETETDFMIEGQLNGKEFILAYSGQYFRTTVLEDGHPIALWQDTPYVIMLSKKHRILPYVQLPATATAEEREDYLLILSLGQLLVRNLMGL